MMTEDPRVGQGCSLIDSVLSYQRLTFFDNQLSNEEQMNCKVISFRDRGHVGKVVSGNRRKNVDNDTPNTVEALIDSFDARNINFVAEQKGTRAQKFLLLLPAFRSGRI